MVTPSYHLETLAARAIERLEAARRSYVGRPEAFEAYVHATTAALMDEAAQEHRALLGDDPQLDRIREELLERFAPRYARIALAQSRAEARSNRALDRGDLLARGATFAAAMLVALLLSRFIRGPSIIAVYFLVFTVPFLPEVRGWMFQRQYEQEIQSLLADMARIQRQL